MARSFFQNAHLCTLLLSLIMLPSCSSEDDEVGPQCCALKKYCANCEYCEDDEQTIANGENEGSCKSINDSFLDKGRYCSPTDQTIRTTEFLAACQ